MEKTSQLAVANATIYLNVPHLKRPTPVATPKEKTGKIALPSVAALCKSFVVLGLS